MEDMIAVKAPIRETLCEIIHQEGRFPYSRGPICDIRNRSDF